MYKKIGLVLCLLVAIGLYGCGNAQDEDGQNNGGGNPSLSLAFSCPDLPSDHLYCSSPSLNWPAPGQGPQLNPSGQGTLPNQQPGQFACNLQEIDNSWVVTNVSIASNSCRVNGYLLEWKDVRDNGAGGGNWVFVLNPDGTISLAPGNPPGTVNVCQPGNYQPTVSLDIVLKSYDYVPFVPQVAFSNDSFNRHIMTALAPNRWHLVYDSVPTNQYFALNFFNPANQKLFGPAGSTGNYIVYANGVQIYQILGDNLYFQIDACGVMQVPRVSLNFTFTPDKAISATQLFFGQDVFSVTPMTVAGGNWVASLPNVPIGRYEAQISYLASALELAVQPDLIHGTIAINGNVITSKVVYATQVILPDPTGTPLLLVTANLFFDVFPNGSVVEANGATTPVIIVIPVP